MTAEGVIIIINGVILTGVSCNGSVFTDPLLLSCNTDATVTIDLLEPRNFAMSVRLTSKKHKTSTSVFEHKQPAAKHL